MDDNSSMSVNLLSSTGTTHQNGSSEISGVSLSGNNNNNNNSNNSGFSGGSGSNFIGIGASANTTGYLSENVLLRGSGSNEEFIKGRGAISYRIQQQMGTNSAGGSATTAAAETATATGLDNKTTGNNIGNLGGGGGGGGSGLGGGSGSSGLGGNSGNNEDTNGTGMGGGGGSGSSNNQQGSSAPQYTIPGILHFIQHEWSRFEIERSQWDVDRAELQARIAMLLGERKGQESLKSDLIRRIKMLEYALKQERVKFHRLKYGCDPPQMNEIKPPSDETGIVNDVAPDSEIPYSSVSNTTWRQGRQMLRQYLQEIGYTDTIIDVRSNRVRSLLGMNNSNNAEQQEEEELSTANRVKNLDIKPEFEEEVMANFEFLAQTDVEMSDEDEGSDDLEVVKNGNEETTADQKASQKNKTYRHTVTDEDMDSETEKLYDEFKSIIEETTNRRNLITAPEEEVDASLGLGELAQLTVNNEADATYDASNTKESAYRKTWNAKYTLRSHFDGVRALAFHPEEPVLITASEDHTLKLWNLQKTVPAKKSASLDVEPLYTFRAHSGPVLCLAMSTTGETCYSGGLDGNIHCWKLPNSNIDPYDCYDPSVLKTTFEGHCDAVWGLSVTHTTGNLVSCSADGTVKLWSPNTKVPLLNTYTSEAEGIPSSVDFVRGELDRIVVAYNSAHCIIYDTETGKQIMKLETTKEVCKKFINKVISHPLLPITITAHEDRHIRFWDNVTGMLCHSMVAHLEPVTSLAIDSHGLYLLSGSHDCSIRLWNVENKTCVQEITAHRKKFDESIFDVAFHPSKPYIASAGADGLAKVFV